MNGENIRISLVHLGCARNQVDSEVILGRLAQEGMTVCGDLDDAEVAVVNTCSFIGPAREESFAAIGKVLERKHSGQLKAVLVAGCLAEQFRGEIEARAPGVDAILPLSDYSQISEVVRRAVRGEDARACPGGRPKDVGSDRLRFLTTPNSYAYLRISEGCDHTCTFCIIPSIRGRMRSKPIPALVEEAKQLAALGVKELILVAEDSTWYGRDLGGGEPKLPELCEQLAQVSGIQWIRILYAYPNAFPWKLTEVMKRNPKVLPYLDIPIQHIADPMLRAMRRAGSGDQVRTILNRLREEVPKIVLRTTVILGFPGESEEDFKTLLRFLEEFRFERLGAFAFCDEEKADSFALAGKVDPKIGEERRLAVMQVQERLIAQRNRSLIGKKIRVLVDGEHSPGVFLARSAADAPEIDCSVIFQRNNLKVGNLLEARVTAVSPDGYDLLAQ